MLVKGYIASKSRGGRCDWDRTLKRPPPAPARMEVPECPLTVGQTLEMDLKMSKTHVFDKETSRTIV